MISEKRLLEMKNKLLEEVIDDAEEFLMWFAEHGVELIDEILSYRAAEQYPIPKCPACVEWAYFEE